MIALKTWRAQRLYEQRDAADHFNISPAHWSLLENCKRNAAPELARRIAEETGADFRSMLGLNPEAQS